jgi:hypothetical protein
MDIRCTRLIRIANALCDPKSLEASEPLARALPVGHTAGMDQRDDYADPNLPPSRLPTLRLLAILGFVMALLGLAGLIVCALTEPEESRVMRSL